MGCWTCSDKIRTWPRRWNLWWQQTSRILLLLPYLILYYPYYFTSTIAIVNYFIFLLLLLILLLLFSGILSTLNCSWTGTHWTSTRLFHVGHDQRQLASLLDLQKGRIGVQLVVVWLAWNLSPVYWRFLINAFLNIPVTSSISAVFFYHDKPHLLNNSGVIDLRYQCCCAVSDHPSAR